MLLLDLLASKIASEVAFYLVPVVDLLAAAAVRGHKDVILKLSQLAALQYAQRKTIPEHKRLVKRLQVALEAAKQPSGCAAQPEAVSALAQLLQIHTMGLELAEAERARAMTTLSSDDGQSVDCLCRQPEITARLSHADIQDLLCHAIQQNRSSVIWSRCYLTMLPGRADLTYFAKELLHMALGSELSSAAVDELCKLGNNERLSFDETLELVRLALSRSVISSTADSVACGLLELPVCRRLGMADFKRFMPLAVAGGSVRALAALLLLPAGAFVTNAQLVAAMSSVIDRTTETDSDADTAAAQLDVLCKKAVITSECMQPADADELLIILIRVLHHSQCSAYLVPLCRVLAAQQFVNMAASAILGGAVDKLQSVLIGSLDGANAQSAAEAVVMLSLVPAVAQGVPAELLRSALSAAMPWLQGVDTMRLLNSLQNNNIDICPVHTETLLALLGSGIGAPDGKDLLNKLCPLASAEVLNGGQIVDLMTSALSRKDGAALEAVCRLDSCMRLLDPDTVSGWIFSAIESFADSGHEPDSGNLFVKHLCESAMASRQNLNAGTVSSLLHLAVQSHDVVAVTALCRVDGAGDMDAQQICGLVHAAQSERCCQKIKTALHALM